MRQILIILFSLITCVASAQIYQRMPQHGYEMDRTRILLDLDIPSDTTTNKSGLARIGTSLYAGNGTYWTAAGGGGSTDTTGIRLRAAAGQYITITGTYPNLTFSVNDSAFKYAYSPDGSVGITSTGDTINFTVNNAPNSASPGNYIITYPTIERSNDTVDVIPNIVFQQGTLRDTITTGAQYVVPHASADQKRIDHIFINPSGLLDTAQGIEDSFFAVRPDLAAGSIPIADINVYGVDSIVVSNVGLFQSTAMGYFDSNGKLTGDSTKYFVGSNTLNAPSFKSNVVGGVALSIDGGSAIRAERGSRIVYIDGDSSVTLRSGGYNHKAQLTAQGEFLIGSSGQVRIPSARLAVIDSTKGFLPPVMRGVRMEAISSPATGLIVYNSDSASLCLYNGSAWVKLGSGGSGSASTLQQAFDAAPTAYPQINITPNTKFTIIGSSSAGALALELNKSADPYIQLETAQTFPFDISNRFQLAAGGVEIAQNSADGSYNALFRFKENEAFFQNTGSNGLKYQVGINKSPDSALDVSGGVSFDLYESSDGTDSMVVKNADGGLGIRAIPGGGSTDTTSLSNRINLKANIASPTFTGLITSPALTLTSTTTGFLPNRVTTTQMNAIGSPSDGMMVYNTDEGSMFTYNSDWGWESNSLKYNTVFGTQYFNDLLGIIPAVTAATQDGNIAISTSGGAVTTFTTPTANRQGIIELSTSTSGTGRSYIATSNQTTAQSMVLGGGRILYETSVQVPTLSTSGERFAFVSGFTTTMNNITISNGAAFLYDEGGVATGSAASANWQVLTAAAASRTYTTTATAVTAGQWYKLQVIVNAAGSSVGFYIDGTLVHTETSTIPSAAIGFANQIIKSNGTTARSVLVDYVYLKQKYTTTK